MKIKKNYKQIQNNYKKIAQNSCLNEESINICKNIINNREKEIEDLEYYKKSYRIRCCAAKHNEIKQCTLWERNMNASKNMFQMFNNLITNKKNIYYDTKKKGVGNGNIKGMITKAAIILK